MTDVDTPAAAVPDVDAAVPDTRRRHPGRRYLIGAALLPAAWLIPALTHMLRADWLLPPLVLLATASLMRVSRSLFDRIVLALALLVGLTCAAGVAFSVWPWHLHPVPIAGSALTVLVLFATVTGRGPRLGSGRMWRADLGLAAAGLFPLGVIAKPFIGAGLAARFDLVMLGEDLSRFFNSYDAIRGTGAYPFFHPELAGTALSARMVVYPSGSTFVPALLDSFVRSSTTQGTPPSAFTHFVAFFVLSFGLMGVCVVWAADWVARPYLRGWRRVVVAAIASAACGLSTLVSMFVSGFLSEHVGLALLAVVFALLIRPPRVSREYVVIVAALTVGVSFTYYLFLPVVLLVAVVTAVNVRRRLRRIPVTTVIVALAAAPLAALPVLVTYAHNVAEAGDQLVLPGTAIGMDYNLTLGGVLLVLAAAALRWRSPMVRRAALVVATMALFTVGIGIYSVQRTGELGHYFDKSTHATFVTSLIAVGVAALVLHAGGRTRAGRRWATGFAVLATFATFGLVAIPPKVEPVPAWRPLAQVSWGAAFTNGNVRVDKVGAEVVRALKALPAGYDIPTVVVEPYGEMQSYLATKFLSALRRDGDSLDDPSEIPWFGRTSGHLIEEAKKLGMPIRFVVIGLPQVAADLTAFAKANQSYGVEVTVLP